MTEIRTSTCDIYYQAKLNTMHSTSAYDKNIFTTEFVQNVIDQVSAAAGLKDKTETKHFKNMSEKAKRDNRSENVEGQAMTTVFFNSQTYDIQTLNMFAMATLNPDSFVKKVGDLP